MIRRREFNEDDATFFDCIAFPLPLPIKAPSTEL